MCDKTRLYRTTEIASHAVSYRAARHFNAPHEEPFCMGDPYAKIYHCNVPPRSHLTI